MLPVFGGKCSSNHCENIWRKSCSLLLSSFQITCGAQCAGTRSSKSQQDKKSEIQSERHAVSTAVFLSECCMAQRRSLSGRSPFCQRKLSEESQIHEKSVFLKTTITKQTTTKHQPRCSLPESAGAGIACSSDGQIKG